MRKILSDMQDKRVFKLQAIQVLVPVHILRLDLPNKRMINQVIKMRQSLKLEKNTTDHLIK